MIKSKGFNSNRLKSARIYRGKSVEQLSRDTNINIYDINSFEDNKSIPSIENILSFSNILQFPKDYFFEDDNLDLRYEGSFFDFHHSKHKKEESYIEKIILTHKIYNFMERYVSLPKVNIINFSTSDCTIEEISIKVRKYYDLSNHVVMNMVNFLEANGFLISTVNSSKNSVGPFLQKHLLYEKSRYFMVLGNDKKSVPRRNYDLAVLLGHVVIHDMLISINLCDEEFIKIKEEAKSFARAFLLPKDSFLDDLVYPSELLYYVELKRKYIVPIQVMIYRAYELGAISYRKYQYLLKEMDNKGWNNKEPLDAIKGANPVLSKKALEVLEKNNILVGNELVVALSREGLTLNPDEVEDLLGLKRGRLSFKNTKSNNVTVVSFGK